MKKEDLFGLLATITVGLLFFFGIQELLEVRNTFYEETVADHTVSIVQSVTKESAVDNTYEIHTLVMVDDIIEEIRTKVVKEKDLEDTKHLEKLFIVKDFVDIKIQLQTQNTLN